ncbi:MAG: hypothetical protein IKP92_02035 [Lachnospiraceae bacterium]|jgi:hypothetical protein|nr:hypothetical protein [Lachnospiraceae bacterium]
MKAFLIALFSKFGKKMFGGVLRKIIPIVILLAIYLIAGLVLKSLWKGFKKQYIPFIK